MSVTLGDKTKALNNHRETHIRSQAVGRQVSASGSLPPSPLLVVVVVEGVLLPILVGEEGRGRG